MQLVLPKFDHYNPELFLLHRGVEVYFTYKDEGDEPLSFYYVTGKETNDTDGVEFDVRTLTSTPLTTSRKQHAEIIRNAIDQLLVPFEQFTLDVHNENGLSEAEIAVFQALYPERPVPEHAHTLYRAIESNTFHCALFQALQTPEALESPLEARSALYNLKMDCMRTFDEGLHAIAKIKTPD